MENNSIIKIKYLANLAERFSVISGGIKQNQDKWQSFNITAEVIQAHIENILDTGKEIEGVVLRGINADSDITALHFNDGDCHIVPDNDTFTEFSGKNQHIFHRNDGLFRLEVARWLPDRK
jgi:hypothetical protein